MKFNKICEKMDNNRRENERFSNSLVPAENISGLSQSEIEKRESDDYKYMNGVSGNKKPSESSKYNLLPNETNLGNENVQIIVGKDRCDGSVNSGYGGKGHSNSSSLRIATESSGKKYDENGERLYKNPDLKNDSTFLYMSEKTDLDNNLGVAKGTNGNVIGSSGIGIKADNVTVIGNQGIKLVTRTNNLNSKNGQINKVDGIELIAGNDTTDLSPMVRGDKLVDFNREIVDKMEKMLTIMNDLTSVVSTLAASQAAHVHVCTAPTTPSIPSVENIGFATQAVMELNARILPSIVMQKTNLEMLKVNYLSSMGSESFNSRHNKTN